MFIRISFDKLSILLSFESASLQGVSFSPYRCVSPVELSVIPRVSVVRRISMNCCAGRSAPRSPARCYSRDPRWRRCSRPGHTRSGLHAASAEARWCTSCCAEDRIYNRNVSALKPRVEVPSGLCNRPLCLFCSGFHYVHESVHWAFWIHHRHWD